MPAASSALARTSASRARFSPAGPRASVRPSTTCPRTIQKRQSQPPGEAPARGQRRAAVPRPVRPAGFRDRDRDGRARPTPPAPRKAGSAARPTSSEVGQVAAPSAASRPRRVRPDGPGHSRATSRAGRSEPIRRRHRRGGHQRLPIRVCSNSATSPAGCSSPEAHRLGRIERTPAAKDRQTVEDQPLGIRKQRIAPVDGRQQRLVAGGRIRRAPGQQPIAILEARSRSARHSAPAFAPRRARSPAGCRPDDGTRAPRRARCCPTTRTSATRPEPGRRTSAPRRSGRVDRPRPGRLTQGQRRDRPGRLGVDARAAHDWWPENAAAGRRLTALRPDWRTRASRCSQLSSTSTKRRSARAVSSESRIGRSADSRTPTA